MFSANEELLKLAQRSRWRSHSPEEFKDICAEYVEVFSASEAPGEAELDVYVALSRFNRFSSSNLSLLTELISEIRNKFTDKRAADKVIYPLDLVILIIVLARLCGKNTASEISLFYKKNLLSLQFLLPGMPSPRHRLSPTTVNTVIRMISLGEIQMLLETYFGGAAIELKQMCECEMQRERPACAGKETLSFDGQEGVSSFVRGEASRRKKAINNVTVFNSTTKAVLASMPTGKKNRESAAFLKLLPRLDVRGRVIMADALNSRPEVSVAILDHGADYLLCIKNNGGKELRSHLEGLFNREYARGRTPQSSAPGILRKDTAGLMKPALRYCQRISWIRA